MEQRRHQKLIKIAGFFYLLFKRQFIKIKSKKENKYSKNKHNIYFYIIKNTLCFCKANINRNYYKKIFSFSLANYVFHLSNKNT